MYHPLLKTCIKSQPKSDSVYLINTLTSVYIVNSNKEKGKPSSELAYH